jgi:hypothetical protein
VDKHLLKMVRTLDVRAAQAHMRRTNGTPFVAAPSEVTSVLTTFLYTARLAAEPPASTAHVQTFDPTMMSELIAIVREQGWPVSMGRMCAAFKLGSESNCNFRQMAVSESPPGTSLRRPVF